MVHKDSARETHELREWKRAISKTFASFRACHAEALAKPGDSRAEKIFGAQRTALPTSGGELTTCLRPFAALTYSVLVERSLFGFARPAL